ncbi:MAG: primosomal protein N' [Desulfobacterales bacterium]|jgi:primosomal protein N' (replication factor Y)
MANSNSTVIDVAVALPVYNTFSYSVPPVFSSQAIAGKRVLVPFGNRKATGYIMGPGSNETASEIKPIIDLLDEEPLFPGSMIAFFRWVSDYYLHPIGEVIKCALPGGLTIYDFDTLAVTRDGIDALKHRAASDAALSVLNLVRNKPRRLKTLGKMLNQEIPGALIHSMITSGWVIKKREIKKSRTQAKTERFVALVDSEPPIGKSAKTRRKIIEVLQSSEEISLKDLKARIPSAARLIKPLKDAGYIAVYEKRIYRDPFGEAVSPDIPPILTDDQQKATLRVGALLGKGFTTFLLAGVTGSGKTEVYMQLAAEAIARGFSVLILIPEIALISQMERRFRARFGERIAVLHSRLSAGERYDQWLRIMRQEVPIAIGARSAIFAPFSNLGLVIVDEEHDASYKQEGGLRYNARDLAVVRAKLNEGIALLGSATPSIQSYFNVETQKFIELNLTQRVEKRPLPDIRLVDLREAKNFRGIRRYITTELYETLKDTLDRGEQALLFLNRRGFASLPVCAACGETLKCKNCAISLTLHQQANAYKCHYCGFMCPAGSKCSHCGSATIKNLGLGTEKVEAAVKTLFPEARVARMDRDTTRRRGSIVNLLKDLRNHAIDILVGTQMVAKGHDFPNITLVGIICADLSLNFPDFRAGERTFQLLAQVSGRAGRGDIPGSVILQTYNPGHFSIMAAKTQDFKVFYQKEVGYREALNYPPFSRMILLKISGKDKQKTSEIAKTLGHLCLKLRNSHKPFRDFVEYLGPIEAPLPRIAREFRWQILLKGRQINSLHRFARQLLHENQKVFNNRLVKVAIDVDPFFLM